jgi:hypothetical protein
MAVSSIRMWADRTYDTRPRWFTDRVSIVPDTRLELRFAGFLWDCWASWLCPRTWRRLVLGTWHWGWIPHIFQCVSNGLLRLPGCEVTQLPTK